MVSGSAQRPNHERIDRACDVLGSASRRRVIYTLRENGRTDLDGLADAVVSAGLADDRQRAAASLVHTHLPKLADFGVVSYADPADEVSLDDGVEALEPFLAVAAREELDGDRPQFPGRDASDAVASGAPE
ncbi:MULTISPECIES: hypothetical protein [Halorussus]|uniref:DUF7344 domain-containing protein n=1 Tax=Halorussus TaxID=1070314 RepID=UPI000E217315|nr:MULTISPECIES: hypothetical protein [Halorussus]NHN57889.1 hypothetical protein [Halorussus sp. JP-T4]